MPWAIRVRGPSGQLTLSGLEPSLTCRELQALLADKTGITAVSQELLAGFPPKLLKLDDGETSLASLGLSNGETLTLRVAESAAAAPSPTVASTSAPAAAPAPMLAPAPAPAPAPGPLPSARSMQQQEDEELARALALSMEQAQPQALPQLQHQHQQRQQQPQGGVASRGVSNATGPGPAPTSVALRDGSCVVRRVIDSDNSCLFNAVGYVMDRSRNQAAELRRVIADAVAADPVTYNEGFLGKDNAEYCRWILQSQNWGGAIELSILSRHYARQIAAYDIQTTRCDVYGQDGGYSERVMLLYDGLHYDAMAVAAFEGAPEELDVTIFEPEGAQGAEYMRGASQLVDGCHQTRQFTDTANFTLRCGVCQVGLKGQKEAVEHAKTTGHSNFSEY